MNIKGTKAARLRIQTGGISSFMPLFAVPKSLANRNMFVTLT